MTPGPKSVGRHSMAPVKLQNAASSKRVLILLKQCDDMLSIAKATTISPNADYGEANLTIATQLLECRRHLRTLTQEMAKVVVKHRKISCQT